MNTEFKNFPFNPLEVDFQRDLEILRKAKNYRNWNFSLIKPYLGSRVFEVGSAIGNYTDKMLGADLIIASDYEEKYVSVLRYRFSGLPNVKIMLLDITAVNQEHRTELKSMALDTAIALNVIEHIQDDEQCLRTMSEVIRPGGRIIIICPAHKSLYNYLDRSYGHFRRYDKKAFQMLAASINAQIEVLSYFNPFGIMGWVINGKMLKRTTLPSLQTKMFDQFIPLLQRIDKTFTWPAGLSILAVLRKARLGE